MTSWDALILGAVQGLTEFLPISSSGHLELTQLILGFSDLHQYVLFNLICHLGTLCAIFIALFPQLKACFTTQKYRLAQVTLATLPLFPLVLVLKPLKAIFNEPQYLGFCFLFTSLMLFSTQISRPLITPRWPQALTIGCTQAIAVLPGISRSGTTISSALLLGWSKEEAFNFSFLLAIPAILGGTLLEIASWLYDPLSSSSSISPAAFFIGFITSFSVGCLTLIILKQMLLKNQWKYFAWYCLFLGIFTTWWFNLSASVG